MLFHSAQCIEQPFLELFSTTGPTGCCRSNALSLQLPSHSPLFHAPFTPSSFHSLGGGCLALPSAATQGRWGSNQTSLLLVYRVVEEGLHGVLQLRVVGDVLSNVLCVSMGDQRMEKGFFRYA